MTTQPTPSPHQHEPAPFTTGPCIHLGGDRGIYTKLNDGCRGLPIAMVNSIDPVSHANADLIAACFNSCTALWQVGYDGQKVIKALPEIMRFISEKAADGDSMAIRLYPKLMVPPSKNYGSTGDGR